MAALLGTPRFTVGIDLGDRKTVLCRLDAAGRIVEELEISTTP